MIGKIEDFLWKFRKHPVLSLLAAIVSIIGIARFIFWWNIYSNNPGIYLHVPGEKYADAIPACLNKNFLLFSIGTKQKKAVNISEIHVLYNPGGVSLIPSNEHRTKTEASEDMDLPFQLTFPTPLRVKSRTDVTHGFRYQVNPSSGIFTLEFQIIAKTVEWGSTLIGRENAPQSEIYTKRLLFQPQVCSDRLMEDISLTIPPQRAMFFRGEVGADKKLFGLDKVPPGAIVYEL